MEKTISIKNKEIAHITIDSIYSNPKRNCWICLSNSINPIFLEGCITDFSEIGRNEEKGTVDLIAKTKKNELTHYRITKNNISRSCIQFNSYTKVNDNLLVISRIGTDLLYNLENVKPSTPSFYGLTIINENEFYFIDRIQSLLKTTVLQGIVNSEGNYINVKNVSKNINYGPMTKEEYMELRKELEKTKIFNRKQKQKKITNN